MLLQTGFGHLKPFTILLPGNIWFISPCAWVRPIMIKSITLTPTIVLRDLRVLRNYYLKTAENLLLMLISCIRAENITSFSKQKDMETVLKRLFQTI